ncbi:MAG: class 1 fructose-bisphosphatase [Burkholderiales bacterium]|nr:class 1 fructose-bisphosphatase [Burkholderiales bacterium]
MSITLSQYLTTAVQNNLIDSELSALISAVAQLSKDINDKVTHGALAGVLGMAGTDNVQGEHQKKLDVISNEIFVSGVEWTGSVAGMASEEMDDCLVTPPQFKRGKYLITFDPLDGSSNIDINAPIGTIFSITKAPKGEITNESFLIPGRQQVAAGYVMYSPQTILTFSFGKGVVMFTLNMNTGDYILTKENVQIPATTEEFAINMSNMRHWAAPVKEYVKDLLAGKDGPLGKNYNMRWVAAMVAEVHRVLCRGGIFMYPWDNRKPEQPGKLRLMYEANPMSFLIEQAGGAASTGKGAILDLQPEKLHQRVPVFLGAKEEVARVEEYHKKF